MAIFPVGLVHRGQLDRGIKTAVSKLGPEATHVSYSLAEDSTGVPSIFFRIVLTDTAAREENLAEATRQIATHLLNEIRPIEDWGLHPYFNFRSVSEQRRRKDPEWAG